MARLSLGKTPRSERSQTESPLHEMAHRTLLPSSIERLPSGVLVGARVAKSFQVPIVGRSKKKKRTVAEVPFYGTVVDHCSFTEEEGNEAGKDDGPGPGLYRVRFDDGDHEDLDPDEVGRCFFLYNRMVSNCARYRGMFSRFALCIQCGSSYIRLTDCSFLTHILDCGKTRAAKEGSSKMVGTAGGLPILRRSPAARADKTRAAPFGRGADGILGGVSRIP